MYQRSALWYIVGRDGQTYLCSGPPASTAGGTTLFAPMLPWAAGRVYKNLSPAPRAVVGHETAEGAAMDLLSTHEVPPMAKRLTPTVQWLAAGYRHDDVALWQELCEWLDQHGATPGPALPAHLAPLLWHEPANTYLRGLHERHVMPVVHLTGMTKRGGNGWRVKRDWQERLAVLADPSPARLLAWWRALAAAWNERIVHVTEDKLVFVPDPRYPYYKHLNLPHYLCPFCKMRSWSDDPRGVLHRWRSAFDHVATWDRGLWRGVPPRYADCPLVRLRLAIRTAEREGGSGTRTADASLTDEIDRIGAKYQALGGQDAAQLRQDQADHNDHSQLADWSRWEVLGKQGAVEYHIAQLCALWLEPTTTSVREYVAFFRREADCSHGMGVTDLELQIASPYLAAAGELESLLA